MALTVKQVERLREAGRYLDGDGLHLQVTVTNGSIAKSWLFRYARNGRERWMGLGNLSTFTLDEARERARKARQQLHDGIDPIDSRNAERAAKVAETAKAAAASRTFKQMAEDYFAFHAGEWKSAKHQKQFVTSLERFAYPVIGNVAIADIDKAMVIKILRPIWNETRVTADRVRNRVERVIAYAVANDFRPAGDNPAAWNDHLENMLPKVAKSGEHFDALPYAELHSLVMKLRTVEGIPARALEFTILTAGRTNETRGAVWSEFDLKGKTWTVPEARMKAGKEHKVPLSDRAIEILQGLPREGDYVFVGARTGESIGENTMSKLLRKLRPGVTVHGFRSTFKDWATDCTSVPREMVEFALAHAVGNQVEQAYRTTTMLRKRAKLMEDWAVFMDKAYAEAGDNVVQMHKTA